jgi:cytochrome d ubiquinol oxidase subunit I
MAMEGHYQSHPTGAPLILFGWPDQGNGHILYEVAIPKLGSLILKHDANAPLAGLDSVPRTDWPSVPILFWSFRLMVGLGLSMLLLAVTSLLARWRGRLYDSLWLLRFAIVMGPAGFVAVIAGWITTEVGRQPFTIYHLLRTEQSASPLAAPAVAASLAAFALVYFIVFAAGAFYMLRLMGHAPHPGESGAEQLGPIRTAGHFREPALKGGKL